MNKRILALLLISIFTVVAFNSCKKDKKESLDAKFKQFNTDANNYKSESDQADNDINNALQDIPGISGGRVEEGYSSPMCGVTIDSTEIAQKTLVFNFDGVTPCFSPSRTRSGKIKVQLTGGNYWKDKNSVLTITYIDFIITRLSDNKSIRFNGVKTLTNLEGNDWLGFLLGAKKLRYRERAFNINVAFDDGSTAIWNTARVTEWSYTPAEVKISFAASGDTAVNGYSSVDAWGVNRYGQAFTTYYNTPVVSNTYCGLWRFISGELVHNVNNADYTLTLGVDQNGNPTPYVCAYGFKVGWLGAGGKQQSVVLSY